MTTEKLSFTNPDGATLSGRIDLLSRKEDSTYAGDLIGSRAQHFLPKKSRSLKATNHQAMASLKPRDKFTTEMIVGKSSMINKKGNNASLIPHKR